MIDHKATVKTGDPFSGIRYDTGILQVDEKKWWVGALKLLSLSLSNGFRRNRWSEILRNKAQNHFAVSTCIRH